MLYLVVSMIAEIAIQRSDHKGPCIYRKLLWWEALLLHLWKVLGSTFSPFIYYITGGLRGFSQSLHQMLLWCQKQTTAAPFLVHSNLLFTYNVVV